MTPGETNSADLGATELSRADLDKHLRTCSFSFEPGRHPKALSAQVSCGERPVPGEIGGLSGDGREQVSRNVEGAPMGRPVLSGAWGGRIGTLAGRGPRAPLPSRKGLAEPLETV